MTKGKQDIRALSLAELQALFIARGEKKFRATQVYEWLWVKSCTQFSEMTNLSKATRAWLSADFEIHAVQLSEAQKSNDGTLKNAFQLFDEHVVEGVLIPTESRMTACVSSQVGCSLSCSFCATGRLARLRNLNADEIYDQVVHIKQQAEDHYQKPLSNIVYMGMGEPLLNYLTVSYTHLTLPTIYSV